ncbi:ATP-dependent helicase [Candidatus Parcubacteria bacterium]|nr:ATP-dependent helicase [Candidatus Parcubacteria bacterium]
MGFPSKEQKTVIDHKGKPLIVIAAPGTGKTSTIVERMIGLLIDDPNREVSFITFTRTSRRDTDKKVRKEVGEDAFDGVKVHFEFPRISTLHTYAKSIVHKYASLIERDSKFSILIKDRNEHKILLNELIDDLKLEVSVDRLDLDINYYQCTRSFRTDCPIPEDRRQEVLRHLDCLFKFYNTFDLDGIVKYACDILEKEQVNFPSAFLQIDEYQDLNPMDQKLIDLLSFKWGSEVIIVGDDAQSIYGFRHAYPQGIRERLGSEKWEKVYFPDSHRLPPHILRASQSLILGENYLGGKVNIPADNGQKILTLQCTKSGIQIKKVASLIKEIMGKKTNRNGESLNYNDFMVLCPISKFVKTVASTLETEFSLPTKLKEKAHIPDNYWRLLLVLKMLNSSDSLALRQWLKIVGLKAKEITDIRRKAMKVGKSLYDYCSTLETPIIKEIFTSLNKLHGVIDNINEFQKELKAFPHLLVDETLFSQANITLNEETQKLYSIGSVIKFIHEKFGLLDSEDEIPKEDKILVTTMYSAKGIEAEFVFVLWLNDTFIPARNHDIKEELRVLYVALTRAKQDVILSFHERYEKSRYLRTEAMSPFLKKISSHLRIERITKDNFK